MKGLSFLFCLLVAFSGSATAQEPPTGVVLTVTPALAALGQRIAPKGVAVSYPGPVDENASDWEPGTAILRRYQQADLVLLVGAGYAGWVATTALPRARLIDTSAGFADRHIAQVSDIPDHQHGPSGSANHHSAYASHFWMDPELALLQARAAAVAFIALWPDQEKQVAANLVGLERQLLLLQSDLDQEFAALAGANLIASHPVYQYLDLAYGLNLRSFHWEPDQFPEPGDWQEFDAALARNRPNIMIWEAEPLPETRTELERRGVEIITISPSPPMDGTASLRSALGFPERIKLTPGKNN